MIRKEKFDEFFNRQPERTFINLLREPVHKEAPPSFGKRPIRTGEIDVSGMYLSGEFPDPEGVLETAYADFNRFLEVYGMAGKRYGVFLKEGKTRVFEAYKVDVGESGITVTAADTEGVRRALIFIEDMLCRQEGPYLTPESYDRWPHIEARITRGFFSPTNRPPKYGDELSDDIDYYPDEYLNRLAHDGTNGLWIYTSFRALLPPGMVPEFGKGYEKRIEKLRRVIKNCARYGIKVYVFAIEPMAFTEWEMLEKYPQVWGSTTWDGKKCFCTHTEFGRAYCIDSTETMCKLLPGLGGYISITFGERSTGCASGTKNDCPRCSKYTKGEVLAQTVDCLQEGIRRSGKDVQFLSWTYGHRCWDFENIRTYVQKAPDDVIITQNFEDMGIMEQLGKRRLAVDYWLSYPGPSEMFEITAEEAKKCGKKLYAKMQVCSSHEVASVPYIPTPGLVFEKFKDAHRLGVCGVMECWYFGNYPSLMSKAAGELSFLHDFSDKQAFLRLLAGIYWGDTHADEVCRAWTLFEEGYKNYPTNIMYSYYGPMHDGITWELQLEPKNFSLPRSWYSTDKPDGDRFHECAVEGHTEEELDILTARMSDFWKQGIQALDSIPKNGIYQTEEQRSAAHALDVLFESGHNITRFYLLRDRLGWQRGDSTALLQEMEALVHREIELSREMIALCEKDGRLGYHSEAENFKFFPEKIAYRIGRLEALLKTEFPRVRARVEKGLAPLAYYLGEEEGIPKYTLKKGAPEKGEWVELLDGTSRFRASYDDKKIYIEIESSEKKMLEISTEIVLMHMDPAVLVSPDGTIQNAWTNAEHFMLGYDGRLEKYIARWHVDTLPSDGMHFIISVDHTAYGWEKKPMKLRIGEGNRETLPSLWVAEEDPIRTLGKNEASPGDFGWLIPEV